MNNMIIEAIQRIAADFGALAVLLEDQKAPEAKPKKKQKTAPAPEEPAAIPDQPIPEPEPAEPQKAAPAQEEEIKLEDVRAVMAEKARSGYRAEVKALLTQYGLNQLSDATDPRLYAELLSHAEAIGNG